MIQGQGGFIFLIGEFSRKTGMSADTIRFYEKRGFFSKGRQDNGYRVYNEKDLELAQLITFGKSMGFSLKDILLFSKEMSSNSINHSKIQQKLQDKIDHIDSQIDSLKKAKKLIRQKIELCRAAQVRENCDNSI